MKIHFTSIFLLFVLLLPGISKCDELSPKQVIKKYYAIMMNTEWSYNHALTDPSLARLVTKGFYAGALTEGLNVSLPPRISNCKEEKNKALCDVAYFIIGEWNNYDPFCEQHYIETATFELVKKSGEWKIYKTIWHGVQRPSDPSQVVSIPYILSIINGVIDADREELKNKESNKIWFDKKIWHSKQEWLNRVREEEKAFKKAKKAIKEINSKVLKYGFNENEIFIKDLACPKPNPEIIKELKGNKK